jgi:hypothetical protein
VIRPLRTALPVVAAGLLAAGVAHATPAAVKPPPGFNPHKVAFKAGAYRCELGKRVQVRQVSADMQTAVLQWNRRDYTLRAVDARSGALRYEDSSSGLVWLMIPGKSMLLDSSQGQRLADECRA